MSKSLNLAKVSAKAGFNIFWGTVFSTIISSIGIILIAKLLSPSDYGIYSIVLITPRIISLFRDLGIDQATVRYTAKFNSENKTTKIKNVLVASIFFELVLGASLALFAFLMSDIIANQIFNRPILIHLIQIISITILDDALLTVAQAAFIGYEKMKYYSLNLIIHAILKTTFMILLVSLGFGVQGAIIGFTTSSILTGTISITIFYLKIYRKITEKTNKKQILLALKKMLKYGLPLSIASILGGFNGEFYSFLIAIFTTDLLVGNYQLAVNFGALIGFFVTPVTIILFPAFSKINGIKEPETIKLTYRSSVKYASLLILPATFAIMVLSKPLVATIFGDQYQFTPLYLALYVIGYLYTALGFLSVENLIKSQGKTQVNLKLGLIAFILGIILSLILIPLFGIFGLIATHLTTGIPSLVIGLWWIKKNYQATIDWKSSTKILFGSGIATIPTYIIVAQLTLPDWLTLIIGTTIYLVIFIFITPLIGAMNKTDTQNLKEILKTFGPLAPILVTPLKLIEHLITKIQK